MDQKGVSPLRPDIEDVVRDANITQEELQVLERDEERPPFGRSGPLGVGHDSPPFGSQFFFLFSWGMSIKMVI